jgi:hypothetical protein
MDRGISACADLPAPPSADAVRARYLSVWGGRRYLLLVEPPRFEGGRWTAEMERLCCLAVADGLVDPKP